MKKLGKNVIQRTVRSTILLFCTTILIVLATVIAGFGKNAGTDATLTASEKAAVRDVQNMAAAAAVSLHVYMDARITEMLACSLVSDRLREALAAPEVRTDACRALKTWSDASGAYEALLLVDKNGTCVAAAPATLMNRDFGGDTGFKEAIAGKLSVADVHKSDIVASLSPVSKGWTLAIAVPIKGGNDVEGVLMSFLKWSKVQELFRDVRVGDTGYVYLLNQQRQLIGHPHEDYYGKSPRDLGAPQIDDAVRKKAPYTSYEFTNPATGRTETKFMGFAYPKGYGNFPDLGWTVGAGVDRSETVGGQSLWREISRFLEQLLKSRGQK